MLVLNGFRDEIQLPSLHGKGWILILKQLGLYEGGSSLTKSGHVPTHPFNVATPKLNHLPAKAVRDEMSNLQT